MEDVYEIMWKNVKDGINELIEGHPEEPYFEIVLKMMLQQEKNNHKALYEYHLAKSFIAFD